MLQTQTKRRARGQRSWAGGLLAMQPTEACSRAFLPSPLPPPGTGLGCLAETRGQFCLQRLVSKRRKRVPVKAAYIFLQTCPWVCLRSENIVSVGLLGSPLLAGDAQNRGSLLAPVPFADPKHAICGRKENRVAIV